MSTEALNVILAATSLFTLLGVLINIWYTRVVKVEINSRMSTLLELTKVAYLAKGRKQVEDEQGEGG